MVRVPFSICEGLHLKVTKGGMVMAAGAFLGAYVGFFHKGGMACINVGGDCRGKDNGGIIKGRLMLQLLRFIKHLRS